MNMIIYKMYNESRLGKIPEAVCNFIMKFFVFNKADVFSVSCLTGTFC